MKKTVPVLAIIVFMPYVCYAQSKTEIPVKKPAQVSAQEKPQKPEAPRVEVMTFRGKIDSAMAGDAATNIPPMIILIGEDGEKELFTIEPKTAINIKGGAVTLSQVKPGNRAVIEYVVKPVQGFTAVSINLVE